MRKIVIDCASLSPAQLHRVLAQELEFPSWYGSNLDALYDCLTDLEEDTHLVLQDLHDDAFRQTLLEASFENSSFAVTLE